MAIAKKRTRDKTKASYTMPKSFALFHYCVTDAGTRHLDVEHGADGRGDVGDMSRLHGLAMVDMPAHEDEGDVGIIGIPHAVGSADKHEESQPLQGAETGFHCGTLYKMWQRYE